MRNNLTEAEKHLWHELRRWNLEVKFRRQAIIGQYIVDFVCYEKRLIIEVDGGQHAENQKDKIRDQWLRNQGFEILRFWNNEVLGNLDGVFQKIEECLRPPSLTLPTRGRESQPDFKKIGQVMLEFTFCMVIVLLMIFSLIMVLRWAGVDLAERRMAHDEILVRGSLTDAVTNALVPMRQLDPNFYSPIKMNAVWDGR